MMFREQSRYAESPKYRLRVQRFMTSNIQKKKKKQSDNNSSFKFPSCPLLFFIPYILSQFSSL